MFFIASALLEHVSECVRARARTCLQDDGQHHHKRNSSGDHRVRGACPIAPFVLAAADRSSRLRIAGGDASHGVQAIAEVIAQVAVTIALRQRDHFRCANAGG